jgi:hypothetical protein
MPAFDEVTSLEVPHWVPALGKDHRESVTVGQDNHVFLGKWSEQCAMVNDIDLLAW